MHLEFLVEDSSGAHLLTHLLPRIIGEDGDPHTYRIHPYKGIGTIPRDLSPKTDAHRRILLDNLFKILRGYAHTPGIDAVIVLIDSDRKDCRTFLNELTGLATQAGLPQTLFRLAIEEVEAWYLGDLKAVRTAYRNAKIHLAKNYAQDSVCGTWELVTDILHPGGRKAVERAGWPLPGQLKHQWAGAIGPHLDLARNASPSFHKFVSGVSRITGLAQR